MNENCHLSHRAEYISIRQVEFISSKLSSLPSTGGVDCSMIVIDEANGVLYYILHQIQLVVLIAV